MGLLVQVKLVTQIMTAQQMKYVRQVKKQVVHVEPGNVGEMKIVDPVKHVRYKHPMPTILLRT